MRIPYTRRALADLEVALDNISSRSPKAARSVQSRIQTFIELLADYPLMGARTDDPAIRRLLIIPYLTSSFMKCSEMRSSFMQCVTAHEILHRCRGLINGSFLLGAEKRRNLGLHMS